MVGWLVGIKHILSCLACLVGTRMEYRLEHFFIFLFAISDFFGPKYKTFYGNKDCVYYFQCYYYLFCEMFLLYSFVPAFHGHRRAVLLPLHKGGTRCGARSLAIPHQRCEDHKQHPATPNRFLHLSFSSLANAELRRFFCTRLVRRLHSLCTVHDLRIKKTNNLASPASLSPC